jgi:integrase
VNTVRRTLHRAVSDLLTRRYSRGRMLSVIADVATPGENDERTVWMSPEEIQQAIALADVTFAPVIGLAVTTGIDRGPMLLDYVRDYNEEMGLLNVRDSKTDERPRSLYLRGAPVLENAEHWLRQLIAGRDPGEKLVRLSPRQLRDRWEPIREAIGRKDIRWKDLRGGFATYYLLAGGQPRELQHILGHATMTMTTRYLRRVPPGNVEQLRAAARQIGIPAGGHLRIERQG